MKNSCIVCLCILILTVGCAHYGKPPKVAISDQLIEKLSLQLAEINLMVENVREEHREEMPKMVKVIEPWTATPGVKFRVQTPSEREEFNVAAMSKVRVPKAGGFATAEIFKTLGEKEKFIGVISPVHEPLGTFVAHTAKKLEVGDYSVKFYDATLVDDPISFEAIKQYVLFTSKLEEATKKILEKLRELKKEYEKLPIFIEGFSIQLPVITVQIHFKFK